MPVWMQVVLPIFTALLGGGAGFAFGRLGKVLDRRQERRDVEAAAEAAAKAHRETWLAIARAERLPSFSVVALAKKEWFQLRNTSRHRATDIVVTFDDYPRDKVKGLPDGPFDLDVNSRIEFRLRGSKELLEMPNMWIMCAEFAKYPETAKPVWVPIMWSSSTWL